MIALEIRRYVKEDCKAMADLFYDTVHEINKKDYSPKALEVWATGQVDLAAWNKSFLAGDTFVVYKESMLLGFADCRKGYLDRLYVHKFFQGQGIATAMLTEIEQAARSRGMERIMTNGSITAKPFLLKRGFSVILMQEVERNGIFLRNYRMEKELR